MSPLDKCPFAPSGNDLERVNDEKGKMNQYRRQYWKA